MRKLVAVAFLIFSMIAGAIGIAQAQTPIPSDSEAAPVATELAPASEEVPAGASLEVLADTTSDSGAVGMTLYRITLEPGTPIPAHEHYGSVTWYVDSGELTVTVTSGQVWVRCAGCVPGATPDASGFALVPEGTEVVLEAGDWMIQHDTTVHAYSNSGDSDVVIDASTTYSLEESNSTPSASPPLPGTPVAGPPIHRRGCQGGCM